MSSCRGAFDTNVCLSPLCPFALGESKSSTSSMSSSTAKKICNKSFICFDTEKTFFETERNVKIIGVYDTAQIIFIEFSLH